MYKACYRKSTKRNLQQDVRIIGPPLFPGTNVYYRIDFHLMVMPIPEGKILIHLIICAFQQIGSPSIRKLKGHEPPLQ